MTVVDVTFHISVGPSVGSTCVFCLMQVIVAAIGVCFEIQMLHARWLGVPEDVATLSRTRDRGRGGCVHEFWICVGLHGDPGREGIFLMGDGY